MIEHEINFIAKTQPFKTHNTYLVFGGSMVIQNHNCNELIKFLGGSKGSKNEYTVYTIEYDEQCWHGWYLTIREFARPETVKMGEASYIGEEMSTYQFAIKFCPFCGQQL